MPAKPSATVAELLEDASARSLESMEAWLGRAAFIRNADSYRGDREAPSLHATVTAQVYATAAVANELSRLIEEVKHLTRATYGGRE
jgi:hypothetical protein